ncbi:MAG: hypothetical protein H7A23_11960 [Leptospiraceae bacterium]|nr:hypothetical protein [Leptospiraceae bacterium]MCP5495262.1 hypothetical protein [Leptospiraceae bacterium]
MEELVHNLPETKFDTNKFEENEEYQKIREVIYELLDSFQAEVKTKKMNQYTGKRKKTLKKAIKPSRKIEIIELPFTF